MKVIDAFPFFNEIDVLELRLHELDSVVDHFVIVEAMEMHGSNKTRTLVLPDYAERLKQFDHKIQYVALSRLLPAYTDAAGGWARENFQRNALMPYVQELAGPNDLVILSDCDEIPRAAVIEYFRYTTPGSICKLNLDFFYYNVNSYVGPWAHSTIGTLAQYRAAGGLQAARGILDKPTAAKYPIIPDAGWHFSYFGDIEHLRLKIENFAHSSDGFVRDMLARDDKQVAADIAAHRDIYRRDGMQQFQHRVSNDARLPRYFLDNPTKFEKFTEEYFVKQHAALLEGK